MVLEGETGLPNACRQFGSRTLEVTSSRNCENFSLASTLSSSSNCSFALLAPVWVAAEPLPSYSPPFSGHTWSFLWLLSPSCSTCGWPLPWGLLKGLAANFPHPFSSLCRIWKASWLCFLIELCRRQVTPELQLYRLPVPSLLLLLPPGLQLGTLGLDGWLGEDWLEVGLISSSSQTWSPLNMGQRVAEEAKEFGDSWPRSVVLFWQRKQAVLLAVSIALSPVCMDVFCWNWQMIHGPVDSSNFKEFYPNPASLLCKPDLKGIQYFSL